MLYLHDDIKIAVWFEIEESAVHFSNLDAATNLVLEIQTFNLKQVLKLIHVYRFFLMSFFIALLAFRKILEIMSFLL